MKTCTRCKRIQPGKNFYKLNSSKDGLGIRCKPCVKEVYAERPIHEAAVVGEQECKNCGSIKPLVEFGRHRRHPNGRHPWCKVCFKKWQPKAGTPKRVPMYKRSDPDYGRNWNLWRRFKLTRDAYDEMLAAQGGGCAFCGRSVEDNGRALGVDHDHECCDGEYSCGKCVRWILCNRHNNGIGLFDDDVAMLRRAADMLEEWRAIHPRA